MHDVRSSRTSWSSAIRSSSRRRHDRDRRAQSATVGVLSPGRAASASAISSNERPICWATRMKAPANSFVLHAPLELMARRLLLPFVPPGHRRAARERIVWAAAKYERAGDPASPAPASEVASVPDARAALLAALDAGDVE